MKYLRFVTYVILAVLVIAIGLFLHYNLPRTDVVQITGTDVKRIESEGHRTRDVRYINTITRDGKVRVFRNEDTGWGWPPYVKFNSADITGEADALLVRPEKSWVRIRYYGWRLTLYNIMPNAISLKEVEKDYTHIPWFNIIFLTSLAVGIFFIVHSVRRIIEKRSATP